MVTTSVKAARSAFEKNTKKTEANNFSSKAKASNVSISKNDHFSIKTFSSSPLKRSDTKSISPSLNKNRMFQSWHGSTDTEPTESSVTDLDDSTTSFQWTSYHNRKDGSFQSQDSARELDDISEGSFAEDESWAVKKEDPEKTPEPKHEGPEKEVEVPKRGLEKNVQPRKVQAKVAPSTEKETKQADTTPLRKYFRRRKSEDKLLPSLAAQQRAIAARRGRKKDNNEVDCPSSPVKLKDRLKMFEGK
jgi:hypothetical protein